MFEEADRTWRKGLRGGRHAIPWARLVQPYPNNLSKDDSLGDCTSSGDEFLEEAEGVFWVVVKEFTVLRNLFLISRCASHMHIYI